MDEKALFDRDKLIQQLHGEQTEHPAQKIQSEHNTTVYGAEREALERAAAAGLEASKRAAAATVAAEQGKTAILKGIRAGENIYSLLTTACQVIAAATGDPSFKDQTTREIRAIYGWACGEIPPLKIELEAVRERTRRIKRYLDQTDSIPPQEKNVLLQALQEHQETAMRLDGILKNRTEGQKPARRAI